MTQRELAGATHGKIKQSRLSNYEQGTREPGLLEIVAIAQALRTTPGYLAGFTRLEHPLSDDELEAVKALRKLPENQRKEYVKRIKALSLVYQNALPDERLNLPATPDKSRSKLENPN